nr:hypothetical protein [Tanacetum cinerariifolium]
MELDLCWKMWWRYGESCCDGDGEWRERIWGTLQVLISREHGIIKTCVEARPDCLFSRLNRITEPLDMIHMVLCDLELIPTKEIGKSSRIDDKVVQDQRQQDDYDLQDERQDQPKEEKVEPRRSKRERIEKSFGPDLFLLW